MSSTTSYSGCEHSYLFYSDCGHVEKFIIHDKNGCVPAKTTEPIVKPQDPDMTFDVIFESGQGFKVTCDDCSNNHKYATCSKIKTGVDIVKGLCMTCSPKTAIADGLLLPLIGDGYGVKVYMEKEIKEKRDFWHSAATVIGLVTIIFE